MTVSRRPADVRHWLGGRPSLDDMRTEFPQEWALVERELAAVVDSGDPRVLQDYVRQLATPAQLPAGKRGVSASGLDARLAAEVRRHMAAESVRHLSVRAASGVSKGRVRFGLVNGWVAQKLLFERDLVRKPVSMGAFRVLWPLLWQRRRLLPLVEPKGIYCFYSRALIRDLAALVDGRSCLEIAAGDGTLTRFLREAGVDVRATDDHSWSAVAFPAEVERLGAKAALKRYRPQVVVCSWPPADNDFEAAVFQTPSVELYIVIGSRHRLGAGNWQAYERAHGFVGRDDPSLARKVLPPELGSMVRVFERARDEG